ncbi:hypothetical protein [Nonomuraea ferruginea]|uniref:hypothetical protein n=1 Tax=Nonomuraea ferruginea TaxID=46174 RepID=UPI0031E9663E
MTQVRPLARRRPEQAAAAGAAVGERERQAAIRGSPDPAEEQSGVTRAPASAEFDEDPVVVREYT